jgi:hypothetical protein
VVVAVRLGVAAAEYVGEDHYTYTDIQERAQYGSLKIIEINKNLSALELRGLLLMFGEVWAAVLKGLSLSTQIQT